MFEIRPARSDADLRTVAALFDAYAATLEVDLGYQGFEAEKASLPGKYAPPKGELLIATTRDGQVLGCAALRPLPESGYCEMKRLFVRPGARGQGLGRALTMAVAAAARDRGFAELRLDTLPTMHEAIAMYQSLGFRQIAPYYAPTPPGTIFLGLALA